MCKNNETHNLTVSYCPGSYNSTNSSALMLRGRWLYEFGYREGDKVSVYKDDDGRIIIEKIPYTLDENAIKSKKM